MQNDPNDPMKTILELVGDNPDILKMLGRFAGHLFGGETNHFHECLKKVSEELMGNLANMQAIVTRGNAYAH